MDDFIARTFNGATTLQIAMAAVTMLGMIWVFWIGSRNQDRPPRPRDTTRSGDATP